MIFNLRKEVREFEENVKRNASKLVIGRWSGVDQTIKSIAGPKSIGLASYRYILTLYK